MTFHIWQCNFRVFQLSAAEYCRWNSSFRPLLRKFQTIKPWYITQSIYNSPSHHSSLLIFWKLESDTSSTPNAAMTTNTNFLELTRYHEGKIHKHKTELAEISRVFNSKLPVLSLPDELLVKILLEYRDVSIASLATFNRYNRWDYRVWWWCVPSQVCHHWRTVTCANPLLWRYINAEIFLNPPLLELALSRSRQAPLDISVVYSTESEFPPGHLVLQKQRESLHHIFRETPRIRTLRLEVPQAPFSHQISTESVQSPFAVLETLHLRIAAGFGGPEDISPILLHSMTSPLRTLNLSGVVIDWEAMGNLPQTLSSIKVEFPPRNPAQAPERILNLLERLPHLTLIHFTDIPITYHATDKLVSLPHLKHLTLSHSTSWYSMLLVQGLILPPAMHRLAIHLGFSVNDSNPPVPFHSIFSKFKSPSSDDESNAENLLKTQIAFCPDADLELSSALSLITQSRVPVGTWPLHFQFVLNLYDALDWVHDFPPWVDFLQAASFSVYPYTRSMTFIGSYMPISVSRFTRTLMLANRLEKLKMYHGDTDTHLAAALRIMPNNAVPLPKLQRITLKTHTLTDIDGDALYTILKDRKAKGCLLEQVRIYRPHRLTFTDEGTREKLQDLASILTDL